MPNIYKRVFIGLLLTFSPLGGFAQSADDYVIRGNKALAKQDHNNAIAGYGKAIKLNPGLAAKLTPYLARAYGKRGAAAYLNGEYDKAIADFNKSLKLLPDNPDISKARAFAEKARGNLLQKSPVSAAAPKAAAVLTTPAAWQTAPPATSTPEKIKSANAQEDVGFSMRPVFVWAGISLVLIFLMLLFWRKQLLAGMRRSGFSGSGTDLNNLSAAAVRPAAIFMPDPENIQSLMRGEKYEEAREILARKKHLDLTDYDLFLEIYIKLGDFMRAKLTANQIAGEIQNQPGSCEYSLYLSLADNCREKGEAGLASQLRQIAVDRMLKAGSVSDAPQTIYELAAAMEKEGETALALKIYRQFADAGKDYLDATERYKILNTKPAAKDGPQPRFTPGPSPIKTGVQIGGQVLDNRYELKSTLGEGGMGVVYEAWDRKAGQTVAVKRMHSYLKEYPEEYGRFRKEAEIVGRLKHPNIVCIHELLEQAGEIYLVFDYVAGKTLNDVLKERKGIPLQECKDIFNGVCDAVSYAHKNNVIHRDLKPANIMLAGPTRALVMDFGLASELREGLTRVTHQTMSGTPAFMAPEQHAGIVKRECDIYAMGVCLYEMLTGVLPFEGLDVLKQKKSKDYREASTLVTWLPPGVDEVISRALEPEPTMRFADAMDFWSALKDL